MAVTMSSHGVQAVDTCGAVLRDMLGKAKSLKRTNAIELQLNKSDIADIIGQLNSVFPLGPKSEPKKKNKFAIIETVVRDIFNKLLVRNTHIEMLIRIPI